jgi:hypothetical protein
VLRKRAYKPSVEQMEMFAFLTSDLRSPQQNDDSKLDKSTSDCDKRQPQGRIVDLLRKQAQQPPSDTCLGFRPSSRSSDAKKLLEDNSKTRNPALPHSGTVVLTSGHPSGYLRKTMKGPRKPLDTTRVRRLFPAPGCVPPTKVTISSVSTTNRDTNS